MTQQSVMRALSPDLPDEILQSRYDDTAYIITNERGSAEDVVSPDHLRIWSLTPVGLPAESRARKPKSEFGEVTGYNGFGKG